MPGGLICICPWSVVRVILLVFSLLPVHHIKGLLECGHLSSVSHVLAIACTFALRECISLVSQPFQHHFICHLVLPCDSQDMSEAAHVKHIQPFFLVCTHCPRLTSLKQSADYRGFIHWLWYDLKACCWTTTFSEPGECHGSLPNLLIEFTVDGQVVSDGRPQVHKLMNDLIKIP